MTQHTPGPWKTFRPYGTIYIKARLRGSTIQEVASCGPTETPEQQEANARLIASAPELLEALRELLDACKDAKFSSDPFDAIPNARTAIAKATGETK